jgi:hypothetical protein
MRFAGNHFLLRIPQYFVWPRPYLLPESSGLLRTGKESLFVLSCVAFKKYRSPILLE